MNRIHRSALVAIAGVCLSPVRCLALGEADAPWALGIYRGQEAAAIARAWRPQGIKALPVVSNYLDLGQIRRKLDELDGNVRGARDWSLNPSVGLGLFFDEQRPTVVSAILMDGNAERAGIKPGDRVASVNGQAVGSYSDIDQSSKGSDVVELALSSGVKASVRKQRMPAVPLDLLDKMMEQCRVFRKALVMLERQARIASANPQMLAALASQAAQLDQEITWLGDLLQEENKKLSGAFRSGTA